MRERPEPLPGSSPGIYGVPECMIKSGASVLFFWESDGRDHVQKFWPVPHHRSPID